MLDIMLYFVAIPNISGNPINKYQVIQKYTLSRG